VCLTHFPCASKKSNRGRWLKVYKSGGPDCEGSYYKPKMIRRKLAVFCCLSDRHTGNCIGGRINNKNGLFIYFSRPFSKEHPFPIVNSDSYNFDIIMNCAVNEENID